MAKQSNFGTVLGKHMETREAHIARSYIYFFWSIGCVVYSKFYSILEYGLYHRRGYVWASLIDWFISYWYIGFILPAVLMATGYLFRTKKSVFIACIPDLLLLHGIFWLVLMYLVWELPNVKTYDLRS